MSSRILACAVLLSFGLGATSAQATDYKNEYDKKVKAAQDIGALGNDLAGDSINYYTGSVSFSATDLSVPGNNSLPVAVSRYFNVELEHFGGSFGDWDLDMPYLSAVMTASGGWVVSGANPNNRCSTVAAPPDVVVHQDGGGIHTWAFLPSEYWHGYTMHLPGASQSLLKPDAANTVRPTSGGPYYWTTNRDWWFSCIPLAAVQSGYPGGPSAGEGFLAKAPDGTRYWFDRMVMRGATDVEATDTYSGPQTWHFTLPRAEYRIYPSRIEDRFGNWVQYGWNGTQLTSITSSDGRSITLTWTGNYISQVSDGVRTVQYAYYDTSVDANPSTLDKVTRDDGSYWEYGLGALYYIPRPEPQCMTSNLALSDPNWDCYGGGYFNPVAASAYVRHPSGARVDFNFGQRYRYSAGSTMRGYYPLILLDKTIRGAGIADATWKYGIAPDVAETRTACRAGACPSRVTSDEVSPDGSIARRVFGSLNFQDESLLQGELFGSTSKLVSSAGTPLITSSVRWGTAVLGDASPVTGTVPYFYRERDYRYVGPTAFLSGDTLVSGGETFTSTRKMPRNAEYLYERGATLRTLTQAFSPLALPAQVERGSANLAGSPSGYARTETMTYLSDTDRWVLGLPLTTSINGGEVSRIDYDPTLLLPVKTYRYGLSQGTVAYNPNGTAASVTDPRGNVTTLSGWQYGMPSSIVFPASGGVAAPTMSAVISSPGKIESTTNEVGSKTCYAYDGMLRMSGITYSSETASNTCDSTAWSPTTRGFTWVTTTEYGLVGNHWKQTISTGNGKTTTLFNALWQPVLTLTEDTANAATRSFVVYRYDTMGRKTFSSYPVASATVNDALTGTYTDYDALGRPWRTRQDSELGTLTSTTLYLSGFQTRTTNPRGFSTTTSFQLFDDPGANSPVKIEAPEGATTIITRDDVGNPLQVTRSGPAG